MAKKQTQETPQDANVYYQVNTQWGNVQARKHTFNGATYVQQELDSDQAEQFSEMLIEADIFGCVDISDLNSPSVDLGTVLSNIINKKLMRKFFCIVLRREDGSVPTADDFRGRASDYVALIREVWTSFFTLNPALISDTGELFVTLYGGTLAGGEVLRQILDGVKSSGLSLNTAPKPGRK